MAPLLSLLIWLMPIANQPGWLGHGPLRAVGIHNRVHTRSTYSRRQESKTPARKSSSVIYDESSDLEEDDTPDFTPLRQFLPSRYLLELARRLVPIDRRESSPAASLAHPLIPILRC